MTWNHRIVRHKNGDQEWFVIHEVYYDEKGRAYAVTKDAVAAGGDTPGEVIEQLEQMLHDARKNPVIDFDSIPEPGADSDLVP